MVRCYRRQWLHHVSLQTDDPALTDNEAIYHYNPRKLTSKVSCDSMINKVYIFVSSNCNKIFTRGPSKLLFIFLIYKIFSTIFTALDVKCLSPITGLFKNHFTSWASLLLLPSYVTFSAYVVFVSVNLCSYPESHLHSTISFQNVTYFPLVHFPVWMDICLLL